MITMVIRQGWIRDQMHGLEPLNNGEDEHDGQKK
jgi:hypothetical protein